MAMSSNLLTMLHTKAVRGVGEQLVCDSRMAQTTCIVWVSELLIER